jgi:hypothetical protein
MGTDEALQALDAIESRTGRDLTYVRVRALETWRLERWLPPRPDDVVRLAEDVRRRHVRSSSDLRSVVTEALQRIQEMLAAEGQAHQVWDTAARRPKSEPEVSAWIADRLRDDLRGRGIIINREVEVRVNPAGGIGRRTDIHVDAIAAERVEGAQQVTVVVEVKGCWHPQLMTAMRNQLVAEYLSPTRPGGIYLVVWFGRRGWDAAEDGRRADCGRLVRADVLEQLAEQASALKSEGFSITPVVLDASLR